jgi:hypothetical protein
VALCFLMLAVAAWASGCPNNCSGRGVCINRSVCQCYPNWAGVDCSYRSLPLLSFFSPFRFVLCPPRKIFISRHQTDLAPLCSNSCS